MTTSRATSTSDRRAFAAGLLLLLLAGLWLLPASPAAAATYAVDSCRHPDGTPAGTTGWVPSYTGFVDLNQHCASGGTLSAAFDPTVSHAVNDGAVWSFSAAAGTTIKGLTALRSSSVAAGQPSGRPEAFVRTDSGFLERCAAQFACSSLDGTMDFPAVAGSLAEFGVACGGMPAGTCPAGTTSIALQQIRLTISDPTAPVFDVAPAGSLASSSTTARTRSLTYTASDVGGGIFRQALLADGTEVLSQPADVGDTTCVRYPAGLGFSKAAPCRPSVAGTMTFDTSALPDGAHTLELRVLDATDTNKAASSWPVLVDNVAPVIGEITISGEALEGAVLGCDATVDGQTPLIARQWLRAAADGSGAQEIPGATGAAYTVSAQDAGHKLLCRVRATDGGGTSERISSVQAGPFAGGAVVVAKPGGSTGAPGGSTGATGGSSGAAGRDAGGVQGPPALPPCTRAVVATASAQGVLRRTYERSRMSLTGRLTAIGSGAAVAGAPVDLMQTVTRAGTAKRTRIASVRTAADGRFSVRVPRGPSRGLQLVAPGCGAVGPVITQRVRGHLTAKTSTRRVRNKQVARFSGKVHGGYLGRGLPLELQVKVGRTWKDVKAVTSDRRGGYRVSYRFLRTFVRYTYHFRVVSRDGSSWPYLAATSRQVRVRVN